MTELSAEPTTHPRDAPLLEVTDLVTHFVVRDKSAGRQKGTVKAVDGISFRIFAGETLGLVGESGGGKTTVGLSVLGLEQRTSGSVIFQGQDVLQADRSQLKALRRQMQIIFQDPVAALDPRKTVFQSIGEGLRIQRVSKRSETRPLVSEMLERVGLTPSQADQYPHELSGGQLQRVGIARALVLRPRFVVCDEPVSALDVSIQAQIINLLADLQAERGLSYLFVAHNLALVEHISDRVAVMYLGKLVEIGQTEQLFGDPRHPYTRALLSAIPSADGDGKRGRIALQGDTPSPVNLPSGCRFRTRCPDAMPQCSQREPELKEVEPGHWAACFLVD
jgi:peptide/nickel transport system ATP-binding protein